LSFVVLRINRSTRDLADHSQHRRNTTMRQAALDRQISNCRGPVPLADHGSALEQSLHMSTISR
jgi:hypothetical protein